MIITGTLINIALVIIGSILGVLLKYRLPEKIVKTVFQAIGLFTLFLGLSMALKIENYLVVVFALVIGSIVGELIDLEMFTENKTAIIKQKFKFKDEKFSEGMITAFLLYCIGSMTILGAIEEGMKGDFTLLVTKSIMDGFTSVALASVFGIGVAFSVLPMLVFQGGLTIAAFYFGEFFNQSIINDLTAVGGILLIGLGINILEIKKIKIFNIFPAIIFVVIFAWIKIQFGY